MSKTCMGCRAELLVPAYTRTTPLHATCWLCEDCFKKRLTSTERAGWTQFDGYVSRTAQKLRTSIGSRRPPGYTSIGITILNERPQVCECAVCTREGQHEPMCALH